MQGIEIEDKNGVKQYFIDKRVISFSVICSGEKNVLKILGTEADTQHLLFSKSGQVSVGESFSIMIKEIKEESSLEVDDIDSCSPEIDIDKLYEDYCVLRNILQRRGYVH